MLKESKLRVVPGGKYGVNWQESTSGRGHNLAEVRSAVIKEIRRDKKEEAVFWALEMEEGGPKVAYELWQDLRVFALEDIGLADPRALLVVDAAQKLYNDLPHEDSRCLLALAHAICYLAEASKTRFGNELLGEVRHQREQGKDMPIPDYAVDLHTRRGRSRGRGKEHYLTEGALLFNENKAFSKDYRVKALARATKSTPA